ncbi:MAG: hypothetical protein JRJ87_25475 [Deltaproteobacteria bacterium]|nr:hypothetical protein [Deltaproteobacteria bacterium]
MNLCETIIEKLVAGQTLSPEQQSHLDKCPDCQSILATQTAVVEAAAAYRQLDEVGPAETAKVTALLNRPKQSRRTFRRVALTSMALILGILATVAFLAGNFEPRDHDESGEKLLALLDEVSDIANPSSEVESLSDGDLPLFAMGLMEDDDNGDEFELRLPGSYQVLEEALENSWL